MTQTGRDSLSTRRTLDVDGREYAYYSLKAAAEQYGDLDRLPFSMKVLLENTAAVRGWRHGRAGGCRGVRDFPETGACEPGDSVPPGARADAGFHRRSGRRRPRRDARRGDDARRRGGERQPDGARRPRHRPLGDGGRVRDSPGLRGECRAGVQAQPGTLRVPEMGIAGVPQFPRGAAGDGHLPSGEPRISGAGGVDVGGCGRRDGGLSRHAGWHGQPYDDDQRARRARLGRRRDRGGGGHARPARLHADPRCRRLQADRRDGGGDHRHRPRAHRRRNAQEEGRRRQVRRILRTRPFRR